MKSPASAPLIDRRELIVTATTPGAAAPTVPLHAQAAVPPAMRGPILGRSDGDSAMLWMRAAEAGESTKTGEQVFSDRLTEDDLRPQG